MVRQLLSWVPGSSSLYFCFCVILCLWVWTEISILFLTKRLLWKWWDATFQIRLQNEGSFIPASFSPSLLSVPSSSGRIRLSCCAQPCGDTHGVAGRWCFRPVTGKELNYNCENHSQLGSGFSPHQALRCLLIWLTPWLQPRERPWLKTQAKSCLDSWPTEAMKKRNATFGDILLHGNR